MPEVFGAGTLLYVGASKRRAQCLDELIAAGRQVTILEAWAENARAFIGKPGVVKVIQGDVRELWQLGAGWFDVAFWWHGPEHIERKELGVTLYQLEVAAALVVLAAPWGPYPQSELEGNPWERHLWGVEPKYLRLQGYETATIGQFGGRSASQVLAWKRTS